MQKKKEKDEAKRSGPQIYRIRQLSTLNNLYSARSTAWTLSKAIPIRRVSSTSPELFALTWVGLPETAHYVHIDNRAGAIANGALL